MSLEKARRFRATNPESKRASYKKWLDRNPEKARANNTRWRNANPDKVKIYRRGYYKENYQQIKAGVKSSRIKRRKLLKGAGHETIGHIDWLYTLAAWDFRCAYCGMRQPLTQDHVTPLSKGGSHTLDNIVPACALCNGSKGVRDVADFMWELESRGLLRADLLPKKN